ncbi:MAG: gamma carbonic anhydrase family protein [Zoogloeaceae bacterium]|jgi:carbonic anhydrase/acetyltransferase-like protein (isoleucine patch superfamily)|nr:gamma carbonic anhydrase family protein [Zoogloeaceae bacterium]
MLYPLSHRPRPSVARTAWIAPGARVIGDVRLADHANIWFNAVLRGDNEPIDVGESANIQDNCVLHTDPGMPLIVGARVTVGHLAILHSAEIGEGSLIGMGATLLNRCKIGKHCLVGARALITEGKTFPDRVLIVGTPGKIVRELTDEEVARLEESAAHYVEAARRYQTEGVV